MEEERGDQSLGMNSRPLGQVENGRKRKVSEEEDNNGKKKALSGKERQMKWADENKTAIKLKSLKRNFKISIAKDANPEFKKEVNEKARFRKLKQRKTEKNQGSKETEGNMVDKKAENSPKKSQQNKSRQQEQGYKQRKAHNKAQAKVIDELNAQIKVGETVKKKIEMDLATEKVKTMKLEETVKDLKSKLEKNVNDIHDNDVWAGQVYRNMSAKGKQEFRSAFTLSAPKLKNGTISRLRKQTGINFSNLVENKTEDMSEIKKKIVEFARENTMEVPDKRKAEKGVRYRNASLQCLFDNFETQFPNLCTYQTFCKYWPVKYTKPKPSEWGTCLCITCQNFELKFESLRARKLISSEHSMDHILERARLDDFEPETTLKTDLESLAEEEKADVNVAFHVWERVKQTEISKNTGRAKCDKTMRMVRHLNAKDLGEIVLEDYEDYKQHLERDSVIKKQLKKKRIEAEEDDEKVVIHMDWAEQHTLIENKECQSAFFNGRRCYDIHTGYCYTKGDCHGFASLSNSSNHKAEAIIAAIEPKIKKFS